MKRRTFLQGCAAGTITPLFDNPFSVLAADIGALEKSFRLVPSPADPYTWWHWMNGHVTADGITRDLEAMKRVGVVGFHLSEVSDSILPGPVKYTKNTKCLSFVSSISWFGQCVCTMTKRVARRPRA